MAEIYNLLSKEKSDKQKSLLGAYDTINDNIITRQTGYITKGGNLSYNIALTSAGLKTLYVNLTDAKAIADEIAYDIVCNDLRTISSTSSWSSAAAQNTICLNPTGYLFVIFNGNESDTELISKFKNTNIQYKLENSYTESIAYYSEYNLYHNELIKVAKEQAQLFDINGSVSQFFDGTSNRYNTVSNGSLIATSNPSMIQPSGQFVKTEIGKIYTLSATNNARSYVGIYPYNSSTAIVLSQFEGSRKLTFIATTTETLVAFSGTNSGASVSWTNIMLNEGTIPIPYQEYNGAIVHTRDLKDINGTNGKSAYEIAVENGFTGTEQAWLNSLKGANGTIDSVLSIVNGNWYIDGVDTGVAARGPSGINGANGTDGTNGVNGSGTKIFYGVFQINSGTTCTFEVEVGDTIFLTILDEQTQTTYTVTLNITDDFMNGISMINAQVGSYTITFSMSGGLLVIDSINPDTDQLYIISAIGF